MGTPKHLLLLGNKTVIRHCVDTLVEAGINDIVVVARELDHDCEAALAGTPAIILRNCADKSEMADSVRIGLQDLDDEDHSGVLICLSDHPLVTPHTCATLVNLHHEAPDKIILPAFHKQRGHPALFPIDVISDIYFTPSLRDIVHEDAGRVLVIEVPDEGVILDMDTPEDYQVIQDAYASRSRAPKPATNSLSA
jgi:molybdenum cofactor cytidylyltransferase